MAVQYVAEAKRIVAWQYERIAGLEAAGASTLDAEHMLDVYSKTLRLLEEHERSLRVKRQRSDRAPTAGPVRLGRRRQPA